MQLTKPKIQKTIIIILLVGIISALIYLRIQNQTQPTPEEIKKPITKEDISTYQNPSSQTSTFTKQKLPTSTKIHPINNTPIDELTALNLIEQLGYDNPTIQNGIYLIDDPDKKVSIMVNTKTNTLIYNRPFQFSKSWTDDQFTNQASGLLNNYFQNNEIWQNPRSFVQRSPNEGDHLGSIVVHYFPTINNYRIVSSSRTPVGDFGLAKATFNPENGSITLNLELINVDISQVTTVGLKTQSALEADIALGNTITSAIYPQSNQSSKYYESPHVPDNAVFDQFELVYYYDSKATASMLRPMYLASGEALLSTGEKAAIKTLVSATKEE